MRAYNGTHQVDLVWRADTTSTTRYIFGYAEILVLKFCTYKFFIFLLYIVTSCKPCENVHIIVLEL